MGKTESGKWKRIRVVVEKSGQDKNGMKMERSENGDK